MTTKVNQLVRHLKQLQTTNYADPAAARAHNADAKAALFLIFHIGREQITFTNKQKQDVATALVAALKPIQINIEQHSFEYRRRLDSLILKKRSALQFLVDNYGEFPIQGSGRVLSSAFKQANLKETIGILDEIIDEVNKESSDESDSEDYQSDRNFPGIPSSHSWW